MIIGFWSEQSGKGAVTYNMIATGIGMSMKLNKNVILVQAKTDYNRLDYAFVPYSGENIMKEDYGYYNFAGIDSVLNRMENGFYDNELLYDELICVRNTNLYYLPSTRKGIGELFNSKITKMFSTYMDSIKNTKDIILVELCNGFEYITKEFLNNFDVLAINISQDNKALEDIRSNNMIMEKSIFVIGRYDEGSEFNLKNISRRYRIREDCIGVIPYNVRYKDSVCQGKCKEFFDRHFNTGKEDEEYIFMNYVKNTADIIINRAYGGKVE